MYASVSVCVAAALVSFVCVCWLHAHEPSTSGSEGGTYSEASPPNAFSWTGPLPVDCRHPGPNPLCLRGEIESKQASKENFSRLQSCAMDAVDCSDRLIEQRERTRAMLLQFVLVSSYACAMSADGERIHSAARTRHERSGARTRGAGKGRSPTSGSIGLKPRTDEIPSHEHGHP